MDVYGWFPPFFPDHFPRWRPAASCAAPPRTGAWAVPCRGGVHWEFSGGSMGSKKRNFNDKSPSLIGASTINGDFPCDLPSGKLTQLLKMAIEIIDLPIKNGDFLC